MMRRTFRQKPHRRGCLLLLKTLWKSLVLSTIAGVALGQAVTENAPEFIPIFSDYRYIIHLQKSRTTYFVVENRDTNGKARWLLWRYKNGAATPVDVAKPPQVGDCKGQWQPIGLKASSNGEHFAVIYGSEFDKGYPVCGVNDTVAAVYSEDETLLRSLADMNLLSGNFRFALRKDPVGAKRGCQSAMLLLDLQTGGSRPVAVCKQPGTQAYAIPFALDEEGRVFRIGAGIVGTENADGSNRVDFPAAIGNEPHSYFFHHGPANRALIVGGLMAQSLFQGGSIQLLDMNSKKSRVISFSGFAPILHVTREVVTFLARTPNSYYVSNKDSGDPSTSKVFQYDLRSNRISQLSASLDSFNDCAAVAGGLHCLSYAGKVHELTLLPEASNN